MYRLEGTEKNGYSLNFVLKFGNSTVPLPEGYGPETVDKLEQQYVTNISSPEKQPTVIVIMNETFADLKVLGNELQTSKEIIPFFNSLDKNTIRGYALSSVFGGRTANSEYEFLSGNTMGFLPADSLVYQQFIKVRENYTLMSSLKELEYNCYAMHPADSKNWARESTYPLLGFDDSYFVDDFPQENLLRGHVSDQEMYEQLISLYEEKSRDENLFLFGITMQNHSGYDDPNFPAEIQLEGYSKEYPDVEQYLTLLRYSDQALQYLVEYFEAVEDDVVILFFGDHMPRLDDVFYRETHGGDYTTLDEQMLQYMVPFAIWANYDIEEQYIPCTSLNFLSNYLFETMGTTLPAYNAFLLDVNEVIPAMNSIGYYSKSKERFIPYSEATGIEAEILHQYQILQYNCLLDSDRSHVFFPAFD